MSLVGAHQNNNQSGIHSSIMTQSYLAVGDGSFSAAVAALASQENSPAHLHHHSPILIDYGPSSYGKEPASNSGRDANHQRSKADSIEGGVCAGANSGGFRGEYPNPQDEITIQIPPNKVDLNIISNSTNTIYQQQNKQHKRVSKMQIRTQQILNLEQSQNNNNFPSNQEEEPSTLNNNKHEQQVDHPAVEKKELKNALQNIKLKQKLGNFINQTSGRRYQLLEKVNFKMLNDLSVISLDLLKSKSRRRKGGTAPAAPILNAMNGNNVENTSFLERLSILFPPFNPSSRFKLWWDILQMAISIFILFYIPIHLVFQIELTELVPGYLFRAFLPISIALDILVSLNTALFLKGVLSMDRKIILRNYIQTTFKYDLIARGPLVMYVFLPLTIDASDEFSPLRFLILSCFYKVVQFGHVFKQVEDVFPLSTYTSNVISLVKLLFSIILNLHVSALVWLFVAFVQIKAGKVNTWMHAAAIEVEDWQTQYVYSYYFSTVTMITVGYGDISPKSVLEKLVSILNMMIACGQFAYSVNSIGNIFADFFKLQNEIKANMYVINNYMSTKNVSKDLQCQIREYLQYYWKEEKSSNTDMETKILEQLSQKLRDTLLMEANKIALRDSPIFNMNFSEQIIHKTLPLIEEFRCTPEEIIYLKGDQDDQSIYFIEKGCVEAFTYQRTPFNKKMRTINSLYTMGPGQSFGSFNFFTGQTREVNMRSNEFTTLLKVKRADFLSLLKDYPDDYEVFCMIRDRAIYSSELHQVGVKCQCCDKADHLLPLCPLIHFVPQKFTVIRQFAHGCDQRRSPFERSLGITAAARIKTGAAAAKVALPISKQINKFNTLLHQSFLEERLEEFTNENSIEIRCYFRKYFMTENNARNPSNQTILSSEIDDEDDYDYDENYDPFQDEEEVQTSLSEDDSSDTSTDKNLENNNNNGIDNNSKINNDDFNSNQNGLISEISSSDLALTKLLEQANRLLPQAGIPISSTGQQQQQVTEQKGSLYLANSELPHTSQNLGIRFSQSCQQENVCEPTSILFQDRQQHPQFSFSKLESNGFPQFPPILQGSQSIGLRKSFSKSIEDPISAVFINPSNAQIPQLSKKLSFRGSTQMMRKQSRQIDNSDNVRENNSLQAVFAKALMQHSKKKSLKNLSKSEKIQKIKQVLQQAQAALLQRQKQSGESTQNGSGNTGTDGELKNRIKKIMKKLNPLESKCMKWDLKNVGKILLQQQQQQQQGISRRVGQAYSLLHPGAASNLAAGGIIGNPSILAGGVHSGNGEFEDLRRQIQQQLQVILMQQQQLMQQAIPNSNINNLIPQQQLPFAQTLNNQNEQHFEKNDNSQIQFPQVLIQQQQQLQQQQQQQSQLQFFSRESLDDTMHIYKFYFPQHNITNIIDSLLNRGKKNKKEIEKNRAIDSKVAEGLKEGILARSRPKNNLSDRNSNNGFGKQSKSRDSMSMFNTISSQMQQQQQQGVAANTNNNNNKGHFIPGIHTGLSSFKNSKKKSGIVTESSLNSSVRSLHSPISRMRLSNTVISSNQVPSTSVVAAAAVTATPSPLLVPGGRNEKTSLRVFTAEIVEQGGGGGESMGGPRHNEQINVDKGSIMKQRKADDGGERDMHESMDVSGEIAVEINENITDESSADFSIQFSFEPSNNNNNNNNTKFQKNNLVPTKQYNNPNSSSDQLNNPYEIEQDPFRSVLSSLEYSQSYMQQFDQKQLHQLKQNQQQLKPILPQERLSRFKETSKVPFINQITRASSTRYSTMFASSKDNK